MGVQVSSQYSLLVYGGAFHPLLRALCTFEYTAALVRANCTRHKQAGWLHGGALHPLLQALCTFEYTAAFARANRIRHKRIVCLHGGAFYPGHRNIKKGIMGIIEFFINLLKDPRGFIAGWIVALGPIWVYTPLFLIVFVETGLVFFPFLPGDSLLFAAGVFSAEGGGLNLITTLIVFYAAAILGNTSNYWIARFFGSRIIDSGKVKALTPERMAKLDSFFERFGGLTIIITRFMPFFRTFAPFIAGTGHMNFGKFTLYNSIGGVSWVSLFVLVGYFFGGVPFVQQHFEIIVLGIVAVSVLPAIIGAIKAALVARKGAKNAKSGEEVAEEGACLENSENSESVQN